MDTRAMMMLVGVVAAVLVVPTIINEETDRWSIPPTYTVDAEGGIYTVLDKSGATVHSDINGASAIQWAVNHLTAGRGLKEKVLLQGNFQLITGIKLPSYTILELDGKVTKTGGWGTTPTVYSDGTSSAKNHDIMILGGTWDGRKNGALDNSYDSSMFHFDLCEKVTIQGRSADDMLDVQGCRAVYNYRCEYVQVRYVHVHDATEAMGLSVLTTHGQGWNNHYLVEKNWFNDCLSGVYFYVHNNNIVEHVDYNVIRYNKVERIQNSGLSISIRGMEDVGYKNEIYGNTVSDCGIDGTGHKHINIGWSGDSGGGFGVRKATYNKVYDNIVTETLGRSGGGLNIHGDHCEIYGNKVTMQTAFAVNFIGNDNILRDNVIIGPRSGSYAAILVHDGHDNTISDNTIQSGLIGIDMYVGLSAVCDDNTIYKNTFNNLNGAWLKIQAGVTDTLVKSNKVTNCGGMINSGTRTVVT